MAGKTQSFLMGMGQRWYQYPHVIGQPHLSHGAARLLTTAVPMYKIPCTRGGSGGGVCHPVIIHDLDGDNLCVGWLVGWCTT